MSNPSSEFARDLAAAVAARGVEPAELARRAGLEPAAVTAALSGAALPSAAVLTALLQAAGVDPAGWEERRRAAMRAELAAAEGSVAPPPPPGAPPSAPPAPPAQPPRPAQAPGGPPPPPPAPPASVPPAAPRSVPPSTPPSVPPAASPSVPPAAPPAAPRSTPPVASPPPAVPAEPAEPATNVLPPYDPGPVSGPADVVPGPGPTTHNPNALPPQAHVPRSRPPRQAWDGPDPATLSPIEADDPREVGGYQLRARLGSGGMGRVYLSYTPGGRPVALKVIRGEFADDPEFRRRFQQEVAAAQRVQGLYTAPVIDTDPAAAQPWLATAYVAGPSLHEAVLRHGPLPPHTALVLMAGVAEALQSVHAANVVHRDLKPSNVILASDGPRVIDFGIARAADATPLTRTGMSIGTPAFMAPEQAQGTGATPATDVFALGALTAFAATGQSPFGEGTDSTVLYRVVHQDADLSGCPEPVRSVVARCLAKDPAQRPTPAQVIELCRHASGDTRLQIGEGWLPPTITAEVTARLNAEVPRLPKDPAVARRRRRRLVSSLVALVVLAAGGAAAAVVLTGGDDKKPDDRAQNAGTVTGGPTPGASPSAPATTSPGPRTSTRPTPSASTSAPVAAGVNVGGVVTTASPVNAPVGYCIHLREPKKPQQGTCYGEGVNFRDDEITSKQVVLLDAGSPADYAACHDDTRYADSVKASVLKVGSVLCVRDKEDELLASMRIDAFPSEGGASSYWTVSFTVWRTEPTN